MGLRSAVLLPGKHPGFPGGHVEDTDVATMNVEQDAVSRTAWSSMPRMWYLERSELTPVGPSHPDPFRVPHKDNPEAIASERLMCHPRVARRIEKGARVNTVTPGQPHPLRRSPAGLMAVHHQVRIHRRTLNMTDLEWPIDDWLCRSTYSVDRPDSPFLDPARMLPIPPRHDGCAVSTEVETAHRLVRPRRGSFGKTLFITREDVYPVDVAATHKEKAATIWSQVTNVHSRPGVGQANSCMLHKINTDHIATIGETSLTNQEALVCGDETLVEIWTHQSGQAAVFGNRVLPETVWDQSVLKLNAIKHVSPYLMSTCCATRVVAREDSHRSPTVCKPTRRIPCLQGVAAVATLASSNTFDHSPSLGDER